jgi:hypothetical protein
MGRGEPAYDLRLVQLRVGQGRISSIITRAAIDAASSLHLDVDHIVEAVLALGPEHFYKSMESEACPGLWQDVYHLEYRHTWMYVKLQLLPDGRAVVVQFKRK